MSMRDTASENDRLAPADSVEKKVSDDRGNGLFAKRQCEPQEQILFVQRPLISALDTSQLNTICYACLRSSDATVATGKSEAESVTLKTCTGCQTVRFCNKVCQKRAWKGHHKYECPIFERLQPRVLPSSVRGVLRLLLQRQYGLVEDGMWKQLSELESHRTELEKAGGEKWENLLLMTRALKTYSNTSAPIDEILSICCTVMVNSFTLTTPTFDPIGVALDPTSALINHSCDPNAIIRFDMTTSTSMCPPPKIHHGSISVHALRPIKTGEELRITYIDAAMSRERRRGELKERYFFDCDCGRCRREVQQQDGALQVSGSPMLEEAQSLLRASSSQPSNPLPDIIPRIQSALTMLQSRQRTHPMTLDPAPQLRHQLVLSLIAQQDFDAAMRQNIVLCFKIDPVLYPEPWHPCRVVSKWRLLRLVRYCMVDATGTEPSQDGIVLRLLACTLVTDLVQSMLGTPQNQACRTDQVKLQDGRMVGQMEMMVAQAQQDMLDERWGAECGPGWEKGIFDDASVRERVMVWVDRVVKDVLGNHETAE